MQTRQPIGTPDLNREQATLLINAFAIVWQTEAAKILRTDPTREGELRKEIALAVIAAASRDGSAVDVIVTGALYKLWATSSRLARSQAVA